MKRTMGIAAATLLAAATLGVLATPSGARESGCKVNDRGKDSAKVTCSDKHGSFTVGTGKLPQGFPKSDVPLPKGKIAAGVSTEVNGEPAYSVTVKVKGNLSDAADAYKAALEDKGFTEPPDTGFSLGGSGGGGLVAFQVKGSDWDVSVIGAGGAAGAGRGKALQVTVQTHQDDEAG